MSKMFYTLQEASEKLGVGEDQVKQLASDGKLQQFRDGNRLMFKRDQVESISSLEAGQEPEVSLEDPSGDIPQAGSGDTDQIDLTDESLTGDSAHASGISVFEAGEIEEADTAAQTQVTKSADDQEQISLESVGSGSGLLDLTRESDDTSLGAELLDEIYPGSEGSDAKMDALTGSGTGVSALDSGLALDGGTGVAMEGIEGAGPAAAPAMAAVSYEDAVDGAGNGLSVGLLLAATVLLVIGLIVGISAIGGVPNAITSAMTRDQNTFWIYAGSLIGGSLVLGVVGMFIGKSLSR